jgi:hypothetical protein
MALAGSVQAQDAGAPAPGTMPHHQASISSATYTGAITEHVAQFEASFLILSTSTNQILPLFGDEVALQDFSVQSGAAKMLREDNKLSLLLPDPGETSVTLKFVVKLGGDGSRRRLSFGIPLALASRLSAAIDEPDAEVEFPAAIALQRTNVA